MMKYQTKEEKIEARQNAKAKAQTEAKAQLKELLDLDCSLTDWEVVFIEDMSHRKVAFKEGQMMKLNEIYERRINR